MTTETKENVKDLSLKSVAELRSIIRSLKVGGQPNLADVSGTQIVKLDKSSAISLIQGATMDLPKDDTPVDLVDMLGDNGAIVTNDNGDVIAKSPIAPPAAPSVNGGLGALEGYFIALINQHSSKAIDENKISQLLNDKIKPIIEKLKKGITTSIEIKKDDNPPVKIDVCHKLTAKAIHILTTRQNDKRINLFLSGGAGSGKTKGASIIAKAIGVDFYPMSVGGQTTEAKLIGFTSPIDGQYKMTPLCKAIKHGGLALLDEIDAGNSNVLTVLNMLLSNEFVMFGNELVKVHQDFYCIVAGNTTGYGANRKYVGRNPLDGAFLDRFAFLNWDYDEALEIKLSGNMDWAIRVQKIRRAVDDLKMQFIVSPRATISGAMLLEKTDSQNMSLFSQSEVEDLLIFNKIGADNKAKILSKLEGN